MLLDILKWNWNNQQKVLVNSKCSQCPWCCSCLWLFLAILFSFFISLRFLLSVLCFNYQHKSAAMRYYHIAWNKQCWMCFIAILSLLDCQWVESPLLWFASSYCKRLLLLSSSSAPKWPSEVWANISFSLWSGQLLRADFCSHKYSLWNTANSISGMICLGSMLSLMIGE